MRETWNLSAVFICLYTWADMKDEQAIVGEMSIAKSLNEHEKIGIHEVRYENTK